MTFRETLAAAVENLLDFGYDSRERVDGWLDKLRVAASESLLPEPLMQRKLTAELSRLYRKFVGGPSYKRRHPGLSAYTLKRLEPSLRKELDRRILASAQLIRSNRSESIARTLKRFEGWATAIPLGGTRAQSKREEVTELQKSFASLPFEERRVIVDQGHKLLSSINDITATASDAIAAVWHSHWKESGYDYRPEHKRLDGHVLLVRGSAAMNDGLVKKAQGFEYTDEVVAPAQEPFCRCYYTYLYDLADLPEELLTAKGKLALKTRENRRAANS